MTSGKICYRSDLLGTQVITRDTGKRLGMVSQLWVDVDSREVVAFSLRDNVLSGLVSDVPRYMYLTSVCQIGDVILVENEDAILNIDVDAYNSLIRCEVVTETGELLGKVYGYRFDIDDGKVSSLIISSLGIPQIPDKLVSTYEISMDEVVSSGPDRLIVFEGAEERLNQLTVGVLESLGIGRPVWEQDEEEDYRPTVIRTENQLGTGMPLQTERNQALRRPPVQEVWDEDEWEEERPQREPMRLQRASRQPINYEPDDRWTPATTDDDYEEDYDDYQEAEVYAEAEPEAKRAYLDEPDEDVWADEDESPRPSKRLDMPERVKAPEYEEEDAY
jgi:sporulation protein YlmC with PRC-barrel domain